MTNTTVIETTKVVSKKIGNTEFELLELVQYDNYGEQIDFYDGSVRWYSVQKYVNKIPAGRRHYGPNYDKAYNYFKRAN